MSAIDIKVISPDDKVSQEDFIKTYQQVFAGAPYFEKWERDEVQSMLDKWFDIENSYILGAYELDEMLGFAVGVPLDSQEEAMLEMKESVLYSSHTKDIFYHAEVAVLSDHRGKGLASQMIDVRMQFAKERDFKYIAFRTIESGSMSEPIYLKKGFQRIPNLVLPQVHQGIDGQDVHYNNIFLIRELWYTDTTLLK